MVILVTMVRLCELWNDSWMWSCAHATAARVKEPERGCPRWVLLVHSQGEILIRASWFSLKGVRGRNKEIRVCTQWREFYPFMIGHKKKKIHPELAKRSGSTENIYRLRSSVFCLLWRHQRGIGSTWWTPSSSHQLHQPQRGPMQKSTSVTKTIDVITTVIAGFLLCTERNKSLVEMGQDTTLTIR